MVKARRNQSDEAGLLWRRNMLTQALLWWLEAVDRVQANRRAACLVLATLSEQMVADNAKGAMASWKVGAIHDHHECQALSLTRCN